MANTLTIEQASAVLNAAVNVAQGKDSTDYTGPADFTTVAQRALLVGADPIQGALQQVLTKTTFKIKKYSEKFTHLSRTEEQWGNHIRQIHYGTLPAVNGVEWDPDALADGQSVDHYVIRKRPVVQTNFYGGKNYDYFWTRFRHQWNVAMRGPAELAEFIGGLVTEENNDITAINEAGKRACLANLIASYKTYGGYSNVHLLSEYNQAVGESFTKEDVMNPANYESFMKWVYGRIAIESRKMTERTVAYHVNPFEIPEGETDPIADLVTFCDYKDQTLYMYSPEMEYYNARVLSGAYHDDYIKYVKFEPVNFWQSFDDPATVKATPTYMVTGGALQTAEAAVTVSEVFALLISDEAAGYTNIAPWSAVTPLNARGGYWDYWTHWTGRYWNDFTEKGVLFTLD